MGYLFAPDVDLDEGETYLLSYYVKVDGSHWQSVKKIIAPDDRPLIINPFEDVGFSQTGEECLIDNIQLEQFHGNRRHQFKIDYVTIKYDNLPDELFRIDE